MTADRYAILAVNGDVENVIVWDGEAVVDLVPGERLTLCPDNVGPGWSLVDGRWVAPPQEEQP